ncbi:MAG: Trm112 family protein [Polyangia bacterium]
MAAHDNRSIGPELLPPELLAPELLAPELLAMVRCPRCRGGLHPAANALQCNACRLLFGVVDGVPNFLLEDARAVGENGR